MAAQDEFHHGLRFKRKLGDSIGAISVHDTNTVGMNLTAPDADNSLPRNEPFLLFKHDHEKRPKLGETGNAKRSLDRFFAGVASAAVLVNLYDTGATSDKTLENAAGSEASLTGLHALGAAASTFGIAPKILLSPGVTNYRVDNAANPVLATQSLIAKQLGAVHISGAPGATDADAFAFRQDFDDERLILFEPFIKTAQGLASPEPFVAAIGVNTDAEIGYHASWGNKIAPGALGISRPIQHHMLHSDNRANYLLSHQINTFINQQGGWRSWGDYAATSNAARQFYCQTRVRDIINEALSRHIWRVISDPMVADKVSAVLDRINALLFDLVSEGKLLGGAAFFEGDRNTVNALEQGKITVNYKSFAPPPITQLNIEYEDEPQYLELLVADVLKQTQFKA
ncbi:hypothetical protein [Polycladidibacter hongkongensis]|uniref:hypothetical protein n=1 Tax=Polycladidibacter hongkongensis TaxID=1647556 RepID=UPI0008377D19|nr:hypothetical protein [Pseudovibrio hongkongensis]